MNAKNIDRCYSFSKHLTIIQGSQDLFSFFRCMWSRRIFSTWQWSSELYCLLTWNLSTEFQTVKLFELSFRKVYNATRSCLRGRLSMTKWVTKVVPIVLETDHYEDMRGERNWKQTLQEPLAPRPVVIIQSRIGSRKCPGPERGCSLLLHVIKWWLRWTFM